MFSDMFDIEEDYTTSAISSPHQRLPRNCAFGLDIPDLQRKPNTPIGLKNQGCTCYLNSLLQILFFTPQFRNVIYKIPLFKQTLQVPTGYLDHPSKTNFILGFQQLFTKMQLLDCSSVGTENLSDAFGWNQGQQGQQHDINESMIVILQTLQRALIKTQFEGLIRESFKIIMKKYIECLNCHDRRDKDPQQLFQLLVYTKDKSTLEEGITCLTIPEQLEGVNCQSEGKKQNVHMGYSIQAIPQVLIITLGRFDFDYARMERVKITTPLSFEAQLNMGKFLQNSGNRQYELYGVLIHSGSAHSGHYFTYIRDIMQQTDWNSSLKQKEEEDQKQRKQKEGKPEPAKKKQDKEDKQKQSYHMKQPNNLQIKKNWYQLNDSAATPIQFEKIASQFGGGQCAYILFYRAANSAPIVKVPPPEYLKQTVQLKNKQIRQKREHYNIQKQHINLIINDTCCRVNVNETINSLVQKYCPKGSSLINVQKKYELPYYPMQLSHESSILSDTILKADLIHESKWITMPHLFQEYKQIRDLIGIDKVPFHLNVLFQNKVVPLTIHLAKTFLELRIMLEEQFKIPYQKQVIKLINDVGKELFLTDDPSNDELTLNKLRFSDHCQIILNYMKSQQEKESNQVQTVKQNDGLISFAIQRDDSSGMKRYFINDTMSLQEAFQYFKKAEGIIDQYKRRLRWTNRNRLFSIDQYEKKLIEFPFEESIVKLKIERGQIPIKGDICVKIKMQSKHQKPGVAEIYQTIQDPNTTLKQLKQQVCNKFELSSSEHKMYRTDWMEEPTRPITKQNQTLFQANFAMEQLLVFRDLDSKIAAELVHLNIHISKTGFHDDCSKGPTFTTQQTKTLKEIKQDMLKIPFVQELMGENPSYKRLRIRQLKRDHMFGTVLRNHNKTLKGNNLQQFNIVVQVLPQEQELTEDDIVLVTRLRDSVNRLYLSPTEFIFRATKTPTLKNLKEDLLVWKQLELPEQELRLFKYYLHDLEWVQWSQKSYKRWMESKQKANKAKQQQKSKQKQENKGGNKKKNDTKKNKQQNSETAEIKTHQQRQQKNQKQTNIKEPSENIQKQSQPKDSDSKQQSKQVKRENQPNQSKGQQKKKVVKQAKKQDIQQQNLRKMPFLLKDGDIIGYGFTSEMLPGDDLQTEQDQVLQSMIRSQKDKVKGRKHVKQSPFALNVDF